MQFLFQPLTWGFLLVAVPVLVHLINMLRHRKQSWAAMDFLLESYRKHRRWVLLKQWLLLASRIAAMILLVAMLARWISASQSLSWFGGRVTHHFILLDDSYSMAEEEKGETAYARALASVQSLIRSIAAQPGEHQLTLLRWSRAELASRKGEDEARLDAAADLMSLTVPRDVSGLLDRIGASQPTSLQLAPDPAIELITPLINGIRGEPVEITFVTDLRRNEWGQPESLRGKMQDLSAAAPKWNVIDCAEITAGNMTLTSLEPEQETWAAGVPLFVKFQVRNNNATAARNVVVKVRTLLYQDGVSKAAPDQPYSGQTIDAPPIVIEQIAPGETVTRQVQVLFGVPGRHAVEVSLPEDRLKIDNRRWCVIGIRQSQKVLLVSDDPTGADAFFLSTALRPDGKLATGMSIETRDSSYLRDAPAEQLASWDVISLLDIPTLDPGAVSKLETYLRAGGGLAYFVGPNTNVSRVNSTLYRDGSGLFPVELEQVIDVVRTPGDSEPQVTATEHPILVPLTTLSASPFQLIEIRKLLSLAGKPPAERNVATVALGPARRPLVLDRPFGEGHVLVVLTGLKVDWSNWAQDPTFVVLALRTMGYLGSFRREPTSGMVGDPITGVITQPVLPAGEVLLPATGEGGRARIAVQLHKTTDDAPAKLLLPVDPNQQDNDTTTGLLRPGIFEAWFSTPSGENVVLNAAHNVVGIEGDLQRVTPAELEDKLQPIKIRYRAASSITEAAWSPEAASPSMFLLLALIAMLIAEQALAYSAGYHLPKVTAGGAS
ncbi:MAG: BatA domain-containing protein [Pirellulales bacterium]